MFFDLLLWQENHNAITVKKTAIIFFISIGIFASEPMTLREIDHVSFLVEHAQTFFAGEATTGLKNGWTCALKLWGSSRHSIFKMADDE